MYLCSKVITNEPNLKTYLQLMGEQNDNSENKTELPFVLGRYTLAPSWVFVFKKRVTTFIISATLYTVYIVYTHILQGYTHGNPGYHRGGSADIERHSRNQRISVHPGDPIKRHQSIILVGTESYQRQISYVSFYMRPKINNIMSRSAI